MPSSDIDGTYVEQQRLNDGYGRSRANSGAYGTPGKQPQRASDGDYPSNGPDQQPHRANGSDPVTSYNGVNGVARQDHGDDLPALQVQGPPDASDSYEPVIEAEAGSYDLVAPPKDQGQYFSLEKQSMALFSKEHLKIIFADPSLLLRFTAFISAHRPLSVPLLVYYLDALKAIRALQYANAITEALEPLKGLSFTEQAVEQTKNSALEKRAEEAFRSLVEEELPAYITHLYINVVSQSIARRITGTLPPHLREASEGLAEVFCLTDPSRKDNPIVFASEEFHRTTQYGMDYVLGRNCRFLQGPNTNQTSVRRLREAIASGRQHQETFLNYRRDGSPFVNLLLMAPLCDSRGKIRYFIGAQVDVSGLVKDCTDMEALRRLLQDQEEQEPSDDEEQNDIITGLKGLNGHTNGMKSNADDNNEEEDEFRALSEMFNMGELSTVRKYGGRMHTDKSVEDSDAGSIHKPRLLLRDSSPEQVLRNVSSYDNLRPSGTNIGRLSGKLSGVYKHYLLVRPYPSLRILFASPSQRVPGILQSPFLSRIGGSPHVREELEAALAEGRGVTAKIRWISSVRSNGSSSGGREGSLTHNVRGDEGRVILDDDAGQGRTRWIHCTPLYGAGNTIGVWMVVMVIPDEENNRNGGGVGSTSSAAKPARMAPPVRMPQPGQRHNTQHDEQRNPRSQPRSDDLDRDLGLNPRQAHHASDQQRYNPSASSRHRQQQQQQQQQEPPDGISINVTSPVTAQTNPYFYGQRYGSSQHAAPNTNGGYAASIGSGRSRGNSIDGGRSIASQGGESLTSLRIG